MHKSLWKNFTLPPTTEKHYSLIKECQAENISKDSHVVHTCCICTPAYEGQDFFDDPTPATIDITFLFLNINPKLSNS